MTTPEDSATIRDVRDAAHATRAALDAVAFIAGETLTPAQVERLADVTCHLRAALAGLDALLDALAAGRAGEGIERGQGGVPPCDA